MNKLTANNEEVLAKLAKNKRRFNWPVFSVIGVCFGYWAVFIWLLL